MGLSDYEYAHLSFLERGHVVKVSKCCYGA